MAKNRNKEARRAAERAAKRHPKAFLAVCAAMLLILLALGAYWYFFLRGKTDGTPAGEQSGTVGTAELTIHFPELGNKYAGDSVLIKIGDVEALIDAGSRQSSASVLADYIGKYCTDGVLEYVIATHADQDHIAAFVGTKSAPGIFDLFECGTIIDFPRTNKDTKILNDYITKRDAEISAGAKHYTALQCWNETEGAQRSYDLAENVTMNILYQRFYEEHSSDENNYSVCVLLSQGDYHYLFTGDLEAAGEESLVENNDLPHCKLFKAGHHGSPTSSTLALLEEITPETVCVCCCAGSTEYTDVPENTFPSQAMIDRVSRFTDRIYVTSQIDETSAEGFSSMNGNIVVRSDGVGFSVEGSANSAVLRETEWFRNNRK